MNLDRLEVTVHAHHPWLIWKKIKMTKVIITQPGEIISVGDCGGCLRVSSSNPERCMVDANNAVFTGIRLKNCDYIEIRKL